MIRELKPQDSTTISKIHLESLSGDFLPSLGKNFLERLYNIIITKKYAYGLVFCKQDKLFGFLIFVKNTDEFFNKIFKKHFFELSLSLIPHLLRNPQTLSQIITTLFYGKKNNTSKTKGELLIIAVDKNKRRMGIGKRLIKHLNVYLVSKKIKSYNVTVKEDHKNAEGFYNSIGFREVGGFEFYAKKWKTLEKKL